MKTFHYLYDKIYLYICFALRNCVCVYICVYDLERGGKEKRGEREEEKRETGEERERERSRQINHRIHAK